jgi:hypothetical protein
VVGLCIPSAQAFEFLAVSFDTGVVSRIDALTGSGTVIAPSGFGSLNALAASPAGTFYSVSGSRLVAIDPWTGAGSLMTTLAFSSGGTDVRALAFSPAGAMFAINDGGNISGVPQPDLLYQIDPLTGQTALVGTTGLRGLQGLDFSPTGTLFWWDIGGGPDSGLGLVRIDPLTGLVTDVNPSIGGLASQVQTLAFGPDGLLYGARDALYTVDRESGALTLIGSGGYEDVRGLAVVPEPRVPVLLGLGLLALGLRRRIGRRNG